MLLVTDNPTEINVTNTLESMENCAKWHNSGTYLYNLNLNNSFDQLLSNYYLFIYSTCTYLIQVIFPKIAKSVLLPANTILWNQ